MSRGEKEETISPAVKPLDGVFVRRDFFIVILGYTFYLKLHSLAKRV